MIVKFPDLDTLRLALTSGAVPADIAQKAAVAGFDESEQVWVETDAKLSSATQKELKRLGAVVCKRSDADLSTEVSSWLELLPLVRADAPLEPLEQTPVLFDVPGGAELGHLILEMLRLGNDRQSFRWLEADGDGGRALLRVVGPPYYSLLRALDQLGGPGVAPHAFVERAPGVWVELGHAHPLTATIRPPKGKLLLLRPPRQWIQIPDAPFRDVYEIVEFQLPDGGTRWQDRPPRDRLRVAPRLKQASPADGAELWVLRGGAIDELNRFVQNVEDQLLGRLAFAVGEKSGQTIVVLRVRQSKLPPPVLVLPAEAYKSYLKLPNLFLPAGFILHPPLRRDVVRKLLAEDAGQITWLAPGADGAFTPESLPEDVFRPLTDWIDYVLDRDKEMLQAWVQAAQFEFEPFVCDEEAAPKPKKPPAEKVRDPKTERGHAGKKGGQADAVSFKKRDKVPEGDEDESLLEAFGSVEKVEPTELEKERRGVEEEFLTLAGTLDDDDHQALWPRLAELNARLNYVEEAGICWVNALWEPAEERKGAVGKWTAAWFRTEAVGTALRQASGQREQPSWLRKAATAEGIKRDVTGEDLDFLFQSDEPTLADVRALAAYLVWASQRHPRPAALMQRLQPVQRFLEKYEQFLPVRACWLAWYHLVHLLDGDVLALARARDRLLERLFHNGLRPEQDLPGFLRSAGLPTGQRFRDVREWMQGLREKARRWVGEQKVALTAVGKKPRTAEYIDLIFAFGLARLGATDASRGLLQQAREVLQAEEAPGHAFLLHAYAHRIEQVLASQPPVGPLFNAEQVAQLEQLERAHKENRRGQHSITPRYAVERLRYLSRIIEPHQRVEPYRYNLGFKNEHERSLIELPDVIDRQELADRIQKLLHEVPKGTTGHELQGKTLRAALDQAPRIGEAFAVDLLDRASRAYDAVLAQDTGPDALVNRASLLQKALLVAAHFGRREFISPLVARYKQLLQTEFRAMLSSSYDSLMIETVDALAGQCLHGLRKLGMREEINQMLAPMRNCILGDKDLSSVAGSKDHWFILRALLPIAGGWYYFGRDGEAEPILQAARALLFRNELEPKEQTALACTYVATLGLVPPELAQTRLQELFERLKGIYDGFSTTDYYGQFQLRLVESVVLAVVSDDFTQGAQARRWLDDDEFLVRRRIHDDHRKMMKDS